MCAIIDANVVGEAFGESQSPAGKAFREAVDTGKLLLVLGGELLDELDCHQKFRVWRAVAIQYSKVRTVNRETVDPLTHQLRASGGCVSDDEHVIALARASGARLLFSNDERLHDDFKNRQLLADPRGKVYTTRRNTSFTHHHRQLLNDRRLCKTNK